MLENYVRTSIMTITHFFLIIKYKDNNNNQIKTNHQYKLLTLSKNKTYTNLNNMLTHKNKLKKDYFKTVPLKVNLIQ